MHTQRKSSNRSPAGLRAPRPEYTAAVRYLDGSRDLFRIRNADDMADARALVLSEVGTVRSVVIALHRS